MVNLIRGSKIDFKNMDMVWLRNYLYDGFQLPMMMTPWKIMPFLQIITPFGVVAHFLLEMVL